MVIKKFIVGISVLLLFSMLFSSAAFASVLPRQSNAPSSTLNYIDMEGKSLSDVFMIESLQGLVNRGTPSIWVLKNPIVEYDTNQPPYTEGDQMVSRDYWFNKLTGYTKVQYTDQFQMVKDFADRVTGCIIYDSTEFDGYTSGARYPQPSDDVVARLNATAMLCAKYNAIALTVEERNTLINSYGVTLPIVASTSTSTFANWYSTYNYMYTNFSSDLRTDCMANVSHFSLAAFDYYIQNKLFIMDMKGSPSSSEQTLQDNIFNRCPSNTPVLGCWNLTGGTPTEDQFQSYLNAQGKFAYATHETFNLSWTSGLPVYQPQSAETDRGLTLDNNKVYISFTETDGDSLEFTHQKFPTWYDMSGRGDYPIGWELSSILSELDPLVAGYFYTNRGQNCFVNPVTGAGYNKNLLPVQYRDAYNSLTSTYLNAAKFRSIRSMHYDRFEGVELSKLSGVQGVFSGYGGYDADRPTVANNRETNFNYLGKPIFINYSYNKYVTLDDIKNYNGPRPAFFSVAAQYKHIDQMLADIKTLPSYFQVVSPNELIDIYKQYVNQYTKNISDAEFDTNYSHEESMYLYGDSGSWIADNNSRIADLTQSFTYKFDLSDNITSATISMDIANNYLVDVSKDNSTWITVAQSPYDCHDAGNRSVVTVNLNTALVNNPTKTVFVRFRDASTGDGWGAKLYHLKLVKTTPTDYTAMWGFNNSGVDASGNGFTAALNGNAAFNSNSRKEGTYSLNLSGSNGYAGSNLVTGATDNVTLCAWIQWKGDTSSSQQILYNGNTGINGYGIYINNSQGNKLAILCGGTAVVQSQIAPLAGEWMHLAAVRRNGTWELYVNGSMVSVSNSASVPNAPSGGTYIGANQSGAEVFNGLVDDVRVYQRALTAGEISALAQ